MQNVPLLQSYILANKEEDCVDALMWNIILYDSESWTLRKKNIKQIEEAEMWEV